MHESALITTVVLGITLAFAFGLAAQRLKIPPIAGYLLAGVAVGPFTPGFVADQALAAQLADIGVILLMFGVGLQFSFEELVSLRTIAVPGALLEMAIVGSMGTALGLTLGWPIGGAIVFGLSFSVASTVVLLRALQDRRLMDTDRGRIAVGWLIVEDLLMALTLVFMPAIATLSEATSAGSIGVLVGLTLAKVVAFGALMLIVGRRVIPMLLHYVAHTGSRELFRLAVLAIALGVAFGAAWLFGVSFALGAFFAGMVLSESQLSQQAAQESLPLRDAFAVLFFVSVGMLFNPAVIVGAPLAIAAAVAIVLLGKSAVAFGLLRLLRQPTETALTMGASLSQIGEFSFILIGLALTLGIVKQDARDLVVATSIICILINPIIFNAAEVLARRLRGRVPEPTPGTVQAAIAQPLVPTSLTAHVVVVGYGRVGGTIGESLKRRPFLVIEDRDEPAARAKRDGAEVIIGNAADPAVLKAANLAGARTLLITIPQAFEAGQILEQARAQNPLLKILARAHSDAEVDYLTKLGATRTVMGEREIARVMTADLVQQERS
ncbi:MAG: Kef family K(+) transporter [Alphaproteobacteria bacterium]|nr:Kef family K(+) transporter [Alphaproteobacteria bacterium]